MAKGKILSLDFCILAFVISVLFIVNVSAGLSIKSLDFIGSSADLKINVTIQNTDANSTSFNFTLKDTTNDYGENGEKQIIYSGTLSIDANTTKSYIFGKYGSYDYSLNSNWENFRCGEHTIEAKISGGNSLSESVDIDADQFHLKFSPDLETGKITPKTVVYITVKDRDDKAISDVSVKISDGDKTKDIKSTDRYGQTSFKISEKFSTDSTGTFTLYIFKHDKVRDRYYCNYEKEFQVKKKLNISSITPENPKANERIKLNIESDDYAESGGVYLSIQNVNNPYDVKYITITENPYYFSIENPGTYKLHIYKSNEYWEDEKTISIAEYPELKISFKEILLGKENEFIITDANDVRISGVKVTLSGEGLNEYKITDYNGIVKFTIKNPGTYKITAEKANYKTTEKTFTALKKLKIKFEPEKENIKIYENVKIYLVDEDNSPVDGTIIVDGKSYSTHEGYINYNFTAFSNYKIVGKAKDFADTEEILKPLKILTLSINKPENEEFSVGENLFISLEGVGLSNAKIEIKNLDTNETKNEEISKNYTMTLLSPGNYEITATAPGFATEKKKFSVARLTMEMNAQYIANENKILINVKSKGKNLENVTIYVITPKNLTGIYKTNADGNVSFDAICEEGNYTIIAKKQYYEDVQKTIEIKRGFDFGIIALILVIFAVILILLFAFLIIKKRYKTKINEVHENKLGGDRE